MNFINTDQFQKARLAKDWSRAELAAKTVGHPRKPKGLSYWTIARAENAGKCGWLAATVLADTLGLSLSAPTVEEKRPKNGKRKSA